MPIEYIIGVILLTTLIEGRNIWTSIYKLAIEAACVIICEANAMFP